jgi:hypothetical protein
LRARCTRRLADASSSRPIYSHRLTAAQLACETEHEVQITADSLRVQPRPNGPGAMQEHQPSSTVVNQRQQRLAGGGRCGSGVGKRER